MEKKEETNLSASHMTVLEHLAYNYEMPTAEMLKVAKTGNSVYLERLAKKRFLPIEVKRAICEYGSPFNCLQLINRGGMQSELYPLIAVKCIDTIKRNTKGYVLHFNAVSRVSMSLVKSVIKDANLLLKNVCVSDLHGEGLTELKHLLKKAGLSTDMHLLQMVIENADFNLLYILKVRNFGYIDYDQACAINVLKQYGNIIWENIETQMYTVKTNNELVISLMLEHMPHSSLPQEVSETIFKHCTSRMIEMILSKKWVGYAAELELIKSKNIKAISMLLRFGRHLSDDAKKAIKKFKKPDWNKLLIERFGYI